MKFVLVGIAYVLIFALVELIAIKLRPPQEVARKLGHILGGIGAALLPFVLDYKEIALLGALFVPGVFIAMKLQLFKNMRAVKRDTYGEIYFPLAICLSALLFPDQLLYTFAVLTLGISDALASLVGVHHGKRKYQVKGGHKTYEGSAAFFISTLVIGFLLTILLVPRVDMVAAAIWSAIIALILTYIEARGGKGVDNLFVPLSAAGLLGMLRAFALLGN